MRFPKTFILSVLSFILTAHTGTDCIGMEASYDIRRLYASDGLCGNKVVDICQDALGRMWFGTTSGVSRYDGASFTNYRKDRTGNLHLSNNNAQVLLALDNGDVWIGTPDSLNIYEYEYDRIVRPGSDDGLIYTDITALCKSRADDAIWIGTFGNGLVRYDMGRNEFDCRTYISVCPCPYITALHEDPNEFLWIGTRYNGLFRLDLRTMECMQILSGGNDYIRCIFQDRSGNIWIGTDNGIAFAKGDMIEKVDNRKLDGHSIIRITEDPTGRIWAGGRNLCLSFSANEMIRDNNADITDIGEGSLKSQISYKSIHSIYCDRSGNIWAGSYGGGVNLISRPDSLISNIYPGIEQNGLNGSANKILAIEKDDSGNLWFGMDGSGLIRYDIGTGEKVHLANGSTYNTEENILLAIMVDSSGNIWTGSYTNGLSVRYKDGRTRRFPTGDTGFTVRSVYESRNGNIYAGCEKGLMWLDRKHRLHKTDLKYDIRAIQEDSIGQLWLATYGNGLIKFNQSSGEITEIGKREGLFSQTVFDLTISNGKVWCATDYGINTVDADGNVLKTVVSLENINTVSITDDSQGNIWAAGHDIIKISGDGRYVKHYYSESIRNIGDFSEGAALSADGKVYFGGFNGVTSINSDAEAVSGKNPSPIIFTSLKIFDQSIAPSSTAGHNPLSKNINIQKRIVLEPWQNVFSVDFVSPEYLSPVEYEYILNGVDTHWNALGQTNSVTFRNLPAQRYHLEIRAHLTGDEVYSGDSIEIVVRPHWYETVAAKIGFVLAIAAIMLFIYSYYASRLKFSYSLEIEKNRRIRDEEINDAKLTFFTNISHELRTPLTLLIAPLEQLIDNETNTTKLNNLKIINKNANRLLTLVNQILDFRKSEKGQMALKVKETDIGEYIESIFNSFEELARERDILYTSSLGTLETKRVWIDPSIIDKICMNLLSNAFKFTGDGGKISISAKVEAGELQICISDNGKGISKEAQDRIFERFYQEENVRTAFSYSSAGSGIGLHLVKSLTELHHGRITLTSEINRGSEFLVIIPCDKMDYGIGEIDTVVTHQDIIGSDSIDNESGVTDISSKPTIVICDDNNEILDYLCSTLNGIYNIIRCTDGETALKSVRENPDIELMVCDIMMPGINGLEVCRTIKSEFATDHIPVILLTAKSGMDDMLEGLECGADAYISKPFKTSHLKVQIKQLLKSREVLRQKYQKKISFEAGGFENVENEEEKFIQKLNQYILEHLSDSGLNWETICKEMNMSRSSLHRKLKALTGLSSGDYIRNLRLGKAAEMLRSTELTISEICFMTGFNSPSYFTSSFRAQYNMSPKEYRTCK